MARIFIPEVELELEPSAQGSLTTVEGILTNAIDGLEQTGKDLLTKDADSATKLLLFVSRLRNLVSLSEEFSLVIDDPTGNSHMTSPYFPSADPQLKLSRYARNAQQNEAIGVLEAAQNPAASEVIQFGETCPACRKANCEANMKTTQVPNFGEVIIMATYCPSCGYRDAEARPGGPIAGKAQRLTLRVNRVDDLKRMVIKSDTAMVEIPEIELELTTGTLGGKLTTIEGLMRLVYDDLRQVTAGDSADRDMRTKVESFCERLDALCKGEEYGYRVVITDPAGRSHIEPLAEPDPDITIEEMERTFEQNEELGLNDMVVDGYYKDDVPEGEPTTKRNKSAEQKTNEAT